MKALNNRSVVTLMDVESLLLRHAKLSEDGHHMGEENHEQERETLWWDVQVMLGRIEDGEFFPELSRTDQLELICQLEELINQLIPNRGLTYEIR